MEGQHAYKKEKIEEKEEAELKAPDSGESCTQSRALRGRGAARANPTALPSSADTNGASAAGSGRVLRDRSTRSMPLWRRKDIADEEEEEDEEEDEAPRRRKAPGPRRKRSHEAATDSTAQSEESKDNSKIQAHGNKRAQNRSRTTTNRANKGSPRPVCKSEPEVETVCEETNNEAAEKKTSGEEKREEEEDEVVLGDGSTVADEPKPQIYDPQTQIENEEGVSSDEDLTFKDDLNDQSYDPKSERDTQKTRRKAPPRLKEKKEKIVVGEKVKEQEKEEDTEMEVTIEDTDGADTKSELGEGPETPRRRGRRRKDDKSPRLPKRRKKPPVQYVRCEMEGCGTVLAHPRYLQHHIKYQHLMKKKYVCPHPSCGRLFRLQKQLLRHAKHHTDQRDYICEFCARAFKSSHNLAVHRMIHTGEKPLQCEICGFTCRQKASLNWHMKKHDADATYQFSCTICNKKFEKKDSVVAHKAKSHPEVLIAEALAANAGTLVTTTTTASGHLTHMDINPVSVLEQEGSAHALQPPVCLSSPSTDEGQRAVEGGCVSLPHMAASSSQTLQTVHFVSTPISQQQLPIQASPQVVHMTFATLPPSHQLPLFSVTHQPPLTTSSSPSTISSLPPVSTALAYTANPHPTSLPAMTSPLLNPTPLSQVRKVVTTLWEGGNTNMTGDWESNGASEVQVMTDSSNDEIQRVII